MLAADDENRLAVPQPSRLAAVRFLNAAPLVFGLQGASARPQLELELCSPAQVFERLATGRADCGLAPIVTLASAEQLEILPGAAIGCRGRVESVIVVGECPLQEADRLLLDDASRTSVILTRLLARQMRGGQEPEYESCSCEHILQRVRDRTVGLLIGDIALAVRGRFPYELDLGAAWHEWTQLPFVFAGWLVRRDAMTARDALALQRSMQVGLRERAQIARDWARTHGGDPARYHSYLTSSIRYALGEREIAGIQEFFDRAADAGLLPRTKARLARVPIER